MTTREQHWQQVWASRSPDEVSWFQAAPTRSLRLISEASTDPDAGVIDVGGGASPLVDGLLERGFTDVSVLDVSDAALARARARLGPRAADVDWLVGDVTTHPFRRTFALWHDRAVFHFLTDPDDRAGYVAQLTRAVAPGGHVVIATFGPDGPETCSGLPVRRHGPDDLAAALGPTFVPVTFEEELHTTPSGGTQQFVYGLFRHEPTP